MTPVAYMFPGQGAQYVGMGKDVYDHEPQAMELYREANKILGIDLAALCFEGPEEELTKTENAQPAIFVTSLAAYLAYLKRKPADWHPQAVLGLSLGEYTALVAAEAIPVHEGLKLVRYRGECMAEASLDHPGTLASVIGLSLDQVKQICQQVPIDIANLNCPGQIVISGTLQAIQEATTLATQQGAKRVIPLEVSGPFHSRWMERAAKRLKRRMAQVEFRHPKINFIPNVTAQVTTNPSEIPDRLIEQVYSTTRWEESIRTTARLGVLTFLEIGPGIVLRGLLHRIDPTRRCLNIGSMADLAQLPSSQ